MDPAGARRRSGWPAHAGRSARPAAGHRARARGCHRPRRPVAADRDGRGTCAGRRHPRVGQAGAARAGGRGRGRAGPGGSAWAATARSRATSRQASMTAARPRRRSTGCSRADAGGTSPRIAASTTTPSAMRLAAAPRRVRWSASSEASSVRPMPARASTAAGSRVSASAMPGRPPEATAAARATGGSACPSATSQSVSVSMPSGARRRRAARDMTVGSSGAASSAQSTRQVAGLLEGLEQGVLGVLVEAMRGADDGHAVAALHGRQRQLASQLLHLRETDLLASALGLEAMQVGMVARGDLATGRAGAAGAVARDPCQAQQPGGEVRAPAWSCRRLVDRPSAARVEAVRCARLAPPDASASRWPTVRKWLPGAPGSAARSTGGLGLGVRRGGALARAAGLRSLRGGLGVGGRAGPSGRRGRRVLRRGARARAAGLAAAAGASGGALSLTVTSGSGATASAAAACACGGPWAPRPATRGLTRPSLRRSAQPRPQR